MPTPIEPTVVKFPLLDVVALPPTHREVATERSVLEALLVEKRFTPVMF